MDGMSKATPLLAKSSEVDFTYSWSDMFFGFIPGSMGETSTVCLGRSWTIIINRGRQLENNAFNMYWYGYYFTFIKSIIIYFR